MDRLYSAHLEDWLAADKRKPLVVRGARQVGKTWLVRHLAESSDRQLLELNLEKRPQLASLFASNDPEQILLNLSAVLAQAIDPEHCLLFIDEIQVAPELLGKLRWFAEDLPELPVIVAGSLLDFSLAQHSFSMPVGRIGYLYLEPLSFEEFLLAMGRKNLYEYLLAYYFDIDIPIAIHEQLMTLFKEYTLVGGLPEAISSWVTERSLIKINQVHHDLLATYRDDFYKYNGRMAVEKLDEVMMAVPKMLGQKFVHSQINPGLQSSAAKQALALLHKARICHPVISCFANGIPLAAEMNAKFHKEIFLDSGLACAALGLNFEQINAVDELILINRGGIAEQLVGQLLRTIGPSYIEPALYYWRRDVKGSNAEIDYVIQYGSSVIPVEVKAGSTGTLKSLHLFMELKKITLAMRVNSDLPSNTEVEIKGHGSEKVRYTLLSMPFYLLGQTHRLLKKYY